MNSKLNTKKRIDEQKLNHAIELMMKAGTIIEEVAPNAAALPVPNEIPSHLQTAHRALSVGMASVITHIDPELAAQAVKKVADDDDKGKVVH